MRRPIVALLAALVLAGCSQAEVQGGWCAFHAYRLVHDVRTHHRGWAALQAVLAAHHCSKALGDLRSGG